MEYNEAEAIMRVAEEIYPRASIAVVGQSRVRPAVTEEDPIDGEIKVIEEEKEYRGYEVSIQRERSLFGIEPIVKSDISKLNKIVKNSEVLGAFWAIEDSLIAFDVQTD